MTVVSRTTDSIGRLGDRILELFVPRTSAAATSMARLLCFCECHYRCYKECRGGPGTPVFCTPCNICEVTPMCGSC